MINSSFPYNWRNVSSSYCRCKHSDNKHAIISLHLYFGIGRTTAAKILEAVNIAPTTKISELNDTQFDAVRTQVAEYATEGDSTS